MNFQFPSVLSTARNLITKALKVFLEMCQSEMFDPVSAKNLSKNRVVFEVIVEQPLLSPQRTIQEMKFQFTYVHFNYPLVKPLISLH